MHTKIFLNRAISALFVIINLKCVMCSLSGFYVDNGHDQTVMSRPLFNEDKQQIEQEILELLGLPDRPKNHHINPSLR